MAHLSLSFFGSPRVTLGDTLVESFRYDKVFALLAYLATEANRPHRRERLAGLLWPDQPERAARRSLSQALYSLRAVVDPERAEQPRLLVVGDGLRLNPDADWSVDVAAVVAALDRATAHRHPPAGLCQSCVQGLTEAVAQYSGPFLAGFSLSDSAPFDEWVTQTREQLHLRAVSDGQGGGHMSIPEPHDGVRMDMPSTDRPPPVASVPWQPATPFEMTPPLLAPTDEELAFAVAANLFDLFRAMGHLPGATVEEHPHLSRHLAAPFNPMFKGVWQSRLTDEEVDQAIGESVAWFTQHGAPFAFWWLDSLTTPAGIGARLQAHGFAPWEEHAPGMAAHLGGLRYELMASVPEGYVQERVTDERGLHDFKQAFVAGFGVPEWAAQAWVDATLAFGIVQAPWRCYVGRLDGIPVASNMLFNGAGVASVFGVATAPEVRGRGIGAAITLIAYDDARQMGYRHGVLFGTELGVSVYRRIGFREVGTTISRYLWRA